MTRLTPLLLASLLLAATAVTVTPSAVGYPVKECIEGTHPPCERIVGLVECPEMPDQPCPRDAVLDCVLDNEPPCQAPELPNCTEGGLQACIQFVQGLCIHAPGPICVADIVECWPGDCSVQKPVVHQCDWGYLVEVPGLVPALGWCCDEVYEDFYDCRLGE